MKTLTYQNYGAPDVLRITEIEKPVPRDNEVLVKVQATTVNRTDCATVRAKPFFMRLVTGLWTPKNQVPGTELAGQVEAIGNQVQGFKPGDRVFGFDDMGTGAHAEYAAVPQDRLSTIPSGLDFEQAAAGVEGAHYAYNFINKLDLKKGQSVLVNGATGAIGSAAVQLLKYFEADVTAVCATPHIELVESLGAERVIDYTRSDFTRQDRRYDYVLDCVGKSSFFKCYRILARGGVYIPSDLGFLSQNLLLPTLTPLIKALLGNRICRFPMPQDIPATLRLVKSLSEQGRFVPVIDRTYPFDRIVEAFEYVETGQKIGNVVISMTDDKTPGSAAPR